jgi:hypothetical protein
MERWRILLKKLGLNVQNISQTDPCISNEACCREFAAFGFVGIVPRPLALLATKHVAALSAGMLVDGLYSPTARLEML